MYSITADVDILCLTCITKTHAENCRRIKHKTFLCMGATTKLRDNACGIGMTQYFSLVFTRVFKYLKIRPIDKTKSQEDTVVEQWLGSCEIHALPLV